MKKEILIVEDDDETIKHIVMHIESEFNVLFHFAKSVEMAIEKLAQKNNIALVIAKYIIDGNVGSSIYAYIKNKELNIPFILLTNKYPAKDPDMSGFMVSGKLNTYLKYPIKENLLLDSVSPVIKLKRPSIQEGYRRVSGVNVELFVMEEIPIFMLDHENNYIHVKNPEIEETQTDDFYFVTIKDYKNISSKINERLTKKIKCKTLPTSERIDYQFDSVKKIHNSLRDLGLTVEEIELGKAVYESSVGIIKKNKRMSGLLGNLIRYQNYTYELSMMTNYLAIAIAGHTKWSSNHSMKKLSISSIFQDISIQEDHLARITSLESRQYKELSKHDKDIVSGHPYESMKLIDEVDGIDDVSNNIRDIIISHHERPTGNGFPKGTTMENISGMSCIFIMAHEFSHRLLCDRLSIEVLQKIQVDFERDYSHGHFRIPYQAFIDSFHQRKN